MNSAPLTGCLAEEEYEIKASNFIGRIYTDHDEPLLGFACICCRPIKAPSGMEG